MDGDGRGTAVDARRSEGASAPFPTGTVTFLLTDIEGSSRLWESDEDGAAERAVARHYELISESIARFGGARPVEQGEGDSVVGAFSSASDALSAALDAQLALGAEDWPGSSPVRVRMALHTGEAHLRDDGRYSGAPLNRCSRLRELAHGGQVLLSRATHDVIGDRLSEGVSLRDMGSHRLRDLRDPEQIFQLCHPELEDDFPPLLSVESKPDNLPAQLTSFVGREQEVATLRRLLERERLVTLTGSGGCGKTRLALEVASGLFDHFPDGVSFVDLGPLGSSALVADQLAASLGIAERGSAPLADAVCRFLAGRDVLVVMDNCEHVADEVASLVHAVLTRCSSVAVLATSREPLRVDGESTWRVPPLTLPSLDDGDPVEALTSSEAGRLFCDRARLARPGYEPSPDEARTIIGLCRQLDGLPLAIELAAGRLRSLDVTMIAQGLADRFRLLEAGPRTAPPRQQTLEASIAWTYDLLDPDEQLLFRRLSVFSGSFAASDAEAVCADESLEASEVLGLLVRLTDRSVLQMDTSPGEARYRMLESIRQFARFRLAGSGEEGSMRDRHLDHWAAVAERFTRNPALSEEAARFGEPLIGDFRAAMDHTVRSSRVGTGLRIAASLEGLFVVLSRGKELQSWLDRLLAADDGSDPAARVAALVCVARLALYTAGGRARRQRAEEALTGARDLGDRELELQAILLLGWSKVFEDPPAACSMLSEGIALADDAEDMRAQQFGREALGLARLYLGDLGGARRTLEEALGFARARRADAYHFVLSALGYVECLMGSFDAAESRFCEARDLAVRRYDRGNEDIVSAWASVLDIYRGSYDSAASVLAHAIGRARTRSATPRLGLLCQGLLDVAQGDARRALDVLNESIPALRAPAMRGFVAQAQRLAGDAASATGDKGAAVQHWRAAMATAESSGSPVAMCVAAIGISRVAEREDDRPRARSILRNALRHAVGCGYAIGVVDALEAIGIGEATDGDGAAAARILAAVDAERERIGYVRFPIDRPSFDAAKAKVDLGLGERFQVMWTEGSALSLTDAIALASRGDARPPRPPTGWDSLTPAELRVVKLVGEGLTNPEIGERLFISPRTVQTHLRHVFEKLGVTTRSELAVEVSRMERTEAGNIG